MNETMFNNLLILSAVACALSLAAIILLIVMFCRGRRDREALSAIVSKRLDEALGEFDAGFRQEMSLMQQELTQQISTSQQEICTSLSQSMSLTGQELTRQISTTRQEISASLTQSMSLMQQELTRQISTIRQEMLQNLRNMLTSFSAMNSEQQRTFYSRQDEHLHAMSEQLTARSEELRQTVDTRLAEMRQGNEDKLEQMRRTVDEKLEATLNDRLAQSFKQVSEQLESVHKGLGEMQTLATGVGDLKKVLSNVKTRGILGEIQLHAILEQVLAPEQYAENVVTVPDSRDPVEYAVRLPGDGEGTVWLPIDSKFPGETYADLVDAYDSADPARIKEARATLRQRLRKCAKDISDKYICPPATTNFGILFLPFEGLYAEVVNLGLVEELARDYRVNIAGPTTMAALLNSLQMGFRTLAIQKRSGEVWRVLGEVKTEFGKFSESLQKVQKRIRDADKEVDALINTRTNVMNRKLRSVESVETDEPDLLTGGDD